MLAEVDRLRLDNDSMKKELDFWTKSTTMGARDWCDRLRQAEQKFREAAEKNARLEEALRDLNSKLDQLALMTNCARAVCFEAKAASASAWGKPGSCHMTGSHWRCPAVSLFHWRGAMPEKKRAAARARPFASCLSAAKVANDCNQ